MDCSKFNFNIYLFKVISPSCVKCKNYTYFSSEQLKSIFTVIMYWAIEVIMIAYYANLKIYDSHYQYNEYNSAADLQMAGSIIMMIGFFIILLLHCFNTSYFKFLLITNLLIMTVGLLLILIGMAIMSKYITHNQIYYDYYRFNAPLAFWFLELFLFVLAILVEYSLYYHQGTSVGPINLGG